MKNIIIDDFDFDVEPELANEIGNYWYNGQVVRNVLIAESENGCCYNVVLNSGEVADTLAIWEGQTYPCACSLEEFSSIDTISGLTDLADQLNIK